MSKINLKNIYPMRKAQGGISIAEHIGQEPEFLWQPDYYVHQLANLDEYDESLVIKLRLLSENQFYPNKSTLIEMTRVAFATIYCNFDLSSYPMDKQKCTFKLGSPTESNLHYHLHNTSKSHHNPRESYEACGFEVRTKFFDGNLIGNNDTFYLGFDVEVARILSPFLFKYYLPCGAIVLVSLISFIVPLTAIPGRIGLVVTQFLTLTNIFIHHMVNIFIV